MSYAMRFSHTGAPGVLREEQTLVGDPGPGEARVRHEAVGLNFIDTYYRSGLYPLPLPGCPGTEAAGTVEAVGAHVTGLRPGDRVAYCTAPPGAYTDVRIVAANLLVPLPGCIDAQTAAAMMLKGLTAQYLLHRTYRVSTGETILVHAAAGGVGLIMCQWAKYLGATVIGTVGSDEKAALARSHGCDHPVNYRNTGFRERVLELTAGKGVPVVYDSVGRDTFLESLGCLQPLGLMVSFGNASGAVAPFDIGELARRGSLFLTRPTLFTYAAAREDLLAMSSELFEVVRSGAVRISIGRRYALRDAAQAHADLEQRKTTGSSLLLP